MENSKTCTSCKKELSLEMFNNNKNHSDGLEYYCKDCKKLYRESLKSKIKSDKLPKKCASCGILKDIECFGNCGGCYDGLKPSCKQCRKEKEYEANKEYILEKKKGKKQIPITPEKRRQYKQKYLLTGRDVIRKASRDYHKRRRLSDPVFKLTNNIRTLIGTSFRKYVSNDKSKSLKTEQILGCTLLEFTQHLESLFTEEMTMYNHGNCEKCWHIDHKIPISSAKNEEEFYKLNHYTNLQPLWSKDNLSKGKKY